MLKKSPARFPAILYYPSRRQPAPAFALLVDALRHRMKDRG